MSDGPKMQVLNRLTDLEMPKIKTSKTKKQTIACTTLTYKTQRNVGSKQKNKEL